MNRRIAITQRVSEETRYPERRDALDQRWAACLEPLGIVAVPVPNGLRDPVAWAKALGIDGLLLTGGNDVSAAAQASGTAPERDLTESRLLEAARVSAWPVLGVCRGMQMMNVHLGGALSAVTGHVATRHPVHRTPQASPQASPLPWPAAAAGLDVNSYHGFGITPQDLASGCVALYVDAQGCVEAMAHARLPWAAVMWHPEREPALAPHDRELLLRLFSSTP